MQFKEIEVKYAADNIKLSDFKQLVQKYDIKSSLLVSSFDDYFVNSTGDFIRYRHGGSGSRDELTIKRKTNPTNNIDRIEVNVKACGNDILTISTFASLMGYKHDFTIYKTCDIVFTDKACVVYYIIYDQEFKEVRRFIEIEALEDYAWESENQAWEHVVEWENNLKSLGITPQHRLRKSLFEIFHK